jgi:biofilm PGA synthesis lipoprotein PgaB
MRVRNLKIGALLLVAQAATAAELPSHLVVLQYHHVSAEMPASTSIGPAQFGQHMQWLADNGFSVVALPESLTKLRAGQALPDKSVAITFDDGYADNYAAAFPVLRERGWPFTMFVHSAPIDAGREGRVTWDELREMAQAGATIANHTTTHAYLNRKEEDESNEVWLERIRFEIETDEARILAETGQSVKILAYPFGESNVRVRALVTELGYVAFGQHSGPVGAKSDFTNLPRFPLSGPYSKMDTFATKMLTLPMAMVSVTPGSMSKEGDLLYDEAAPSLELVIAHDGAIPALSCFASGQGAIRVIELDVGFYEIRPNEALPVGRSRYNCTFSSGISGRFYWYSYPWIRRGPEDK